MKERKSGNEDRKQKKRKHNFIRMKYFYLLDDIKFIWRIFPFNFAESIHGATIYVFYGRRKWTLKCHEEGSCGH